MNFKKKSLASAFVLILGLIFSTTAIAQTSCCGNDKKDKTACTTAHKDGEKASCDTKNVSAEATSGCLPSSCRGAKTKFGEAKVISNLRSNMIALKAKMEQSTTPKFAARSYDIHDIVGNSDAESLAILIRELQLMEKEFALKTSFEPTVLTIPESKAKQVQYLQKRVSTLTKFL
ncbi:hypothetical protein [uncultured Kordia sp.]|uniref:hypothetical protein n=1 Tax=uncultured Kordia sp. TaxID=507699 RepID=UPI00260ED1B0|nr:hypothetical protein [uncultured Kordia sp.]